MSDQPCIVVDYALLGQSARSLRAIGQEFEHAAQIKDDLSAHLGSADIADAMGEFSGNWNRKRLDLAQRIKDTEGFAGSVMASFSEQDRQAAKFDLSPPAAGPAGTPP